jgi:6-phosphogluconolactonase
VGLGDSSDTAAPGMRAHQILTTPSNDWVLVPCLGANHVATLAFDEEAGTFEDGSELDTAAGAGPRHVAISADGATVYLTNELNSTVQVLALDESTGVLTARSTVSSLPSGFSGSNSTAEIALHPNGRVLYVSNRGHDSIAIFAIQDDGTLTAMGHALLMARTPRSFAVDPSGHFLLAGAQNDDEIVRFRIETDGSLTRLGSTSTTGAPTFVGIFEVAR